MKYSELLKQKIKESGISVRKISKLCNEHGVPVTQSYISILSNGTAPPASDRVNKVLVRVLSDHTDLSLAELRTAALKGRLPEYAQELHEEIVSQDTGEIQRLKARVSQLENEMRNLKSLLKGWFESG
ncbi:MAG: peptidase and domain protein [Bacilli bacterium]|nr:peptidase and domain protein [Bacilli bacterium]